MQVVLPVGAGKPLNETLGEGLQPPDDVAGEGCGPRDQRDAVDVESHPLQARSVITGSQEVPRHASFAIYSAPLQGLDKCRPDRLDAAIAAVFGNKASTEPERSVHCGQHRISALDPVKDRVAEHGIELRAERQVLSVRYVRVQPQLPGGLDLSRARIDSYHFTPKLD